LAAAAIDNVASDRQPLRSHAGAVVQTSRPPKRRGLHEGQVKRPSREGSTISGSFLLGAAATVAPSCGGSVAAGVQTEIQWWHAMGGQLGEAVNTLADGFNKSQKGYKVVRVYKGTYTEMRRTPARLPRLQRAMPAHDDINLFGKCSD
jgi:hypothetical protein